MRNIYNGGMQCKAMDKGETAVFPPAVFDGTSLKIREAVGRDDLIGADR